MILTERFTYLNSFGNNDLTIDTQINKFLKDNKATLIDVKYQAVCCRSAGTDTDYIEEFALLIYKTPGYRSTI